jgi:hypothetical protein
MKQRADHIVTEIKKDIPLLDRFDWAVIGLSIFAIILFIIFIMGKL